MVIPYMTMKWRTELGCECLLIYNGHQSYERLKGYNTRTIDAISGIGSFYESMNPYVIVKIDNLWKMVYR